MSVSQLTPPEVQPPADPLPRPAKSGRSRKASLNSLAAALDYGVRLLVSLVIKPILVGGLGTYGYGAWEVLGRLAGYLGPATGQAGHALRWTTARQQGSDDWEAKRRTVGSAIVVWLLLSPVLFALAALFTWLAPSWLEAPVDSVRALQLTTLILGCNVALTSLIEIPRAVLEGENLGYKRMGLSALLVALGGALTAAAVYGGLGLVGVALATSLTTLATGILYFRVVRVQVPWFGVRFPPWRTIESFFQLSGWFFAWQIVLRLLRASDVVLLGVLANVELVTSYSLTKYGPETAINLVAIVVFGIMPGLGGIIGEGNFRKAAEIRAEIMSLTWLISTLAGAVTLLWNPVFLRLWVGDQFDAGQTSTLLIVILVTQYVLIRSDGNIIDLTLDLRGKVLIGLVATVISLAVAASLIYGSGLGIDGLCLGLIGGRLILSISYPRIVGRALGIPWQDQVARVVRPGVMSAAIFAAAAVVGGRLTITSWAGLVLGTAATALVLPVPLFYLGVRGDIRGRLIARAKSLLQRPTSAARGG